MSGALLSTGATWVGGSGGSGSSTGINGSSGEGEGAGEGNEKEAVVEEEKLTGNWELFFNNFPVLYVELFGKFKLLCCDFSWWEVEINRDSRLVGEGVGSIDTRSVRKCGG